MDNIYVKPATEANRVNVATREIDGVHYPVYIGGLGDIALDAWGTQKASTATSLLHSLFTYDVPAKAWLMYENGSEVRTSTDITSSNGSLKMLTTVTNSVLLLESRECPRYQPNRGHLYSTAGWFPNKTSDGVRDFGLFTAENGVFFRLKADGLLYAVLLRGGVEVLEEVIDTSGLTGFDVEKNNIYDIQIQWRGAGNYYFYIGNPSTGYSTLVHAFNLLGTLTTTSSFNPAQPMAYRATRITEDVEMHFGCVDVTSEAGLLNNRETYISAFAEAVPVTTDTPVLIVHQPLQINSTTNTRTATLARITVTCSKKAVFKVWFTRDLANIIGATFKELANGSYVSTDSPDMNAAAVRATSVITANLDKITPIPVEAAVRTVVENPYRDRIEFPLVRGDYLIVTCTAATASADCVIEWGEQV